MQIMRAIIANHRPKGPRDEHAGPITHISAKHRIRTIHFVGLPTPDELPTCNKSDNEECSKSHDDEDSGQFNIAAKEIGYVCRSRSDDDDGGPVIDLMDGTVEALAYDDDYERER
jgi:hypothetical protein